MVMAAPWFVFVAVVVPRASADRCVVGYYL